MAAAPQSPIVTPPPHTDAYMDMASRRRLFHSFGLGIGWVLLALLMTIAYLTFVLAGHANWLAALLVIAAVGWAAGRLLHFGSSWNVVITILVVAAIVTRIIVALGSAIT